MSKLACRVTAVFFDDPARTSLLFPGPPQLRVQPIDSGIEAPVRCDPHLVEEGGHGLRTLCRRSQDVKGDDVAASHMSLSGASR
jgi:hypothetical protein